MEEFYKKEVITDMDEAYSHIVFDTKTLTIYVNKLVTLNCLYTVAKEKWRSSKSNLIRYEFPIMALHPWHYVLKDCWTIDEKSLEFLKNGRIERNGETIFHEKVTI